MFYTKFFSVLNSVVAEPYHFRGAGAVTRLKLARCDVGVKLLYCSCMSTDLYFLIGGFFYRITLHSFLFYKNQRFYAKNWEASVVCISVVDPKLLVTDPDPTFKKFWIQFQIRP
jgi:hypothetical protein